MAKVGYFIAEYQTFSGSQKSLLYSMRAWQQEGGESIAILPGEGLCSQILRDNKIPTIICEAPPSLHLFQRRVLKLPIQKKLFIWLREVIPYSWKVLKVLKRENCQLLHCNSVRSVLMTAWIPVQSKIPCIMHVRGKPVGGRLLWYITQVLSNRIVVVARHLIYEVYHSFYPKVRLLYNSIDPTEIELLSNEDLPILDSFANIPVIVSFSSLIPGKGIHHLIKTMSLLDDHPKAILVVAGAERDNSYGNFIKKLAAELCPGRFVFLSWLPNPYPLLKQSKVAVLATINKPEEVPTDNPKDMPTGEGLPRFILEAMALKKPVVATKVDGCDEAVIDRETGILVPPSDPEAMAEAIETLLKNPELAKQMGERGRQRIEKHFTIERHRRVLAGIYSELLRGV